MKTTLYRKVDGGVVNAPPSPSWLAIVTGKGLGWSDDVIAFEIAGFQAPGSPESGWAGFSFDVATRFVNAMAHGGLSEDEALILLSDRLMEQGGYTQTAIVDDADLPTELVSESRTFRDAIVWDDAEPTKCRCDMPSARGLHMDKIRAVRNAELVAKDITFMRAVEDGDTDAQATIKTEKQTLRDLPATFDITTGVDTPEKLKDKWPTELPTRE